MTCFHVRMCVFFYLTLQYRDFTLDPHRFPPDQVKDFLNTLHQNNQYYGKHTIIHAGFSFISFFVIILPIAFIIDPGIKIDPGYPAYDRGLAQDVFLKV